MVINIFIYFFHDGFELIESNAIATAAAIDVDAMRCRGIYLLFVMCNLTKKFDDAIRSQTKKLNEINWRAWICVTANDCECSTTHAVRTIFRCEVANEPIHKT